jgi:hypothetical protein
MGMFESLISQLETSEVVKSTIKKFEGVREILVATVNRFDQRFGDAEKRDQEYYTVLVDKLNSVEAKLDRVLFSLDHPSDIAPAGDDGLLAMHFEIEPDFVTKAGT